MALEARHQVFLVQVAVKILSAGVFDHSLDPVLGAVPEQVGGILESTLGHQPDVANDMAVAAFLQEERVAGMLFELAGITVLVPLLDRLVLLDLRKQDTKSATLSSSSLVSLLPLFHVFMPSSCGVVPKYR